MPEEEIEKFAHYTLLPIENRHRSISARATVMRHNLHHNFTGHIQYYNLYSSSHSRSLGRLLSIFTIFSLSFLLYRLILNTLFNAFA